MCSDNFFQWKLRTKNKSKIDVAIAEVNVHVEINGIQAWLNNISNKPCCRVSFVFGQIDLRPGETTSGE